MKSIVIYYSLEGNTDYAAKAIAEALGADTLRLETVEPYPLGAKRFLLGGKDAVSGAAPALKPYAFDISVYDTVILGTPLWAWTFAPPLRTFLNEHDLHGKKLAFFVSSMGGQDKKCFRRMMEALDVTDAPTLSLIDPLKRKKDEDQAAIRAFADRVKAL